MKGDVVKKVLRALALTSALTLVGFTASAGPWDLYSTCWLTCYSLQYGVQNYKTFNVTKYDCCRGAVLSCPPGWVSGGLAWGEPAMLCGPSID